MPSKPPKVRQHAREAWKAHSAAKRDQEPLCRRCLAAGKLNTAVCIDHKVPISQGGSLHDPDNLQPLCAECHKLKSSFEASDQAHRYGPHKARGWLVVGPPAAGKSTWVRKNAPAGDVVWDYDVWAANTVACSAVGAESGVLGPEYGNVGQGGAKWGKVGQSGARPDNQQPSGNVATVSPAATVLPGLPALRVVGQRVRAAFFDAWLQGWIPARVWWITTLMRETEQIIAEAPEVRICWVSTGLDALAIRIAARTHASEEAKMEQLAAARNLVAVYAARLDTVPADRLLKVDGG
jgi:5-methylcytosine-specific restriction endonuclease McrA